MKQLTINGNWTQFLPVLKDLEDFKTYGNLRGERTSYAGRGYLPRPYSELLSRDVAARKLDYVVYSYATPIAWHTTDKGWHFPPVKYSVTTSKAQGRIATALSVLAGQDKSVKITS